MNFTSDTVIGIECHVELATKSKLFCSCPTSGSEIPNTLTCPTCNGFPGSKPVANKKAIEYAIKLALALNCKINSEIIFSRKVYFYDDLSKNYQITQYEVPLGKEGYLTLKDGNRVGLIRVHIEEDPASLVHEGSIAKSQFVLVDYNRSGRPLCEIVTKPEIKSPEEARDFMKRLITILNYLKIFDKECIIKADANISIKESNYTKVEIKNITGFKEIEKALNYEIVRQKEAVQDGEKIVQETRGWDPSKGVTISLRSKESAEDYGYITDTDLVPIDVTKEVPEIKKNMPELMYDKEKKFIKWGIEKGDAEIIAADYYLAYLLEKFSKLNPVFVANWIKRELPRIANYNKKEVDELNIKEDYLFEIVEMLEQNKITPEIGRRILEKLFVKEFSPKEYVKKENLSMVSDTKELKKLCMDAINENKTAVDSYKKGEEKAINYLVGQVMRKSKGKAKPQEITNLLKEILG